MQPDPPSWSPAKVAELAGGLGLEITAAQARQLIAFLGLLQRWNATYNLTAVREPAQMMVQHLADCLALVKPLRRQLGGDGAGRRLLDVGSGGGLPGAVVAIMLPRLDVTCVDAVGKKAAFVRQVAAELHLPNLYAEHSRVQALQVPRFDVVTARAFASLADFTAQTRELLGPQAVWVAMKGKEPHDEIGAVASDLQVFHVEPLTVPGLNAERCLVWMRPTS
jgi:16S rRNA (guanine527-N7)-methyltransferase